MYGKTGFETKRDYDQARYIRLKKEREKKAPPHPISLLTVEEKAYIAGLIDGEGAIYCARKKNVTCHPTIAIQMTNEGVLRWLSQKVGAQKVHTIYRKDDGKYISILKSIYLFRMSGKSAQILCRAILPYLRVKANHARVVCAFPVDARIAPGHKISQTKVNVVRYRLATQLESLNENRYKRRHSKS